MASPEIPPTGEEKIKTPEGTPPPEAGSTTASSDKSPEEKAEDEAKKKKILAQRDDPKPEEKKDSHAHKVTKTRFIDKAIPANIFMTLFAGGQAFFSWLWKKLGAESKGGGSTSKQDTHTGAHGHGGGGHH